MTKTNPSPIHETTLSHTKAHLAAFVAAFMWASAFVGIRVGVKGYGPGEMALLRYVIAGMCMIPAFIFRPHRKRFTVRQGLYAAFIGSIGVGFYNYALNKGEISVTAAVASFVVTQIPIFASIFAAIFLHERVTKKAVIGILISFIGVGIIAITHVHEFHMAIGLLFVFLAALSGATYHTMQKSIIQKFDPIAFASIAIWGGMLSLSMFIPGMLHDFHVAPMHVTWAVIYLGIFPGALGYLANSYALSHLPVSTVVCYLFTMPIMTTIMGWLLISEIPDGISLVGGCIALYGAYLVKRHN